MEVGGCVQVSLVFVVVENRPKMALTKPLLIFGSSIPCVFCLYIHCLKVVGYYDLSVLFMLVMCFQKKKFGWGVGGCGELYAFFLDFFEF